MLFTEWQPVEVGDPVDEVAELLDEGLGVEVLLRRVGHTALLL
jgi:hypothetical protein